MVFHMHPTARKQLASTPTRKGMDVPRVLFSLRVEGTNPREVFLSEGMALFSRAWQGFFLFSRLKNDLDRTP